MHLHVCYIYTELYCYCTISIMYGPRSEKKKKKKKKKKLALVPCKPHPQENHDWRLILKAFVKCCLHRLYIDCLWLGLINLESHERLQVAGKRGTRRYWQSCMCKTRALVSVGRLRVILLVGSYTFSRELYF